MILVDLRNHGKSARIKGLNPPHDMVNAAKDLANLVKSRGWCGQTLSLVIPWWERLLNM